MSGFVYDDGGRATAGFKGTTGDCVCRAIAIATGVPYAKVYTELNEEARRERGRPATGRRRRSSARTGVHRGTIQRYLAKLGWAWTPTMHIGSGCTVHLRADELPAGRLIVSVSRHVTAVIDGVIHDTHDPRRGAMFWYGPDGKTVVRHVPETRCVYGYWRQGLANCK